MSAVFESPEPLLPDPEIASLRIPPHSLEAESSVLGGLLLDNSAWDRVGDLLTDQDFYRYEHRLVFAAISALINTSRPADVITAYEYLQSIGKAQEVGASEHQRHDPGILAPALKLAHGRKHRLAQAAHHVENRGEHQGRNVEKAHGLRREIDSKNYLV